MIKEGKKQRWSIRDEEDLILENKKMLKCKRITGKFLVKRWG